MKTILFGLFLFAAAISFAQVTDNFSDGDFINNPPWSGDVAKFTVNSSLELQLNSTGTDSSYLSVPNTANLNNCEWNFWVKLNFSPSSSNNSRVYLVSDQQNLQGPLNGYYLQFGEALSNDQVELFRQNGNTSTSVCRGTMLISAAFAIRVKVIRDADATWQLYVDSTGGNSFQLEATGTDSTFNSTSYFGVICKYTSSNATKFYFDDIYAGPITADTISEPALPSDIVINEILYNPLTGGEDFVELYNRSSKIINLNSLNIASGDYSSQVLNDINTITGENIYLLPEQYAVLTESPEAVMAQYYCPSQATFVQVTSMPAYNVDNDIVAIVDAAQTVIDKLSYSDSWQFPLLNDTKGISLERINPDKPTQDSTNWHSAAESIGFATPGYRNSQYSETTSANGEISIEPEIFSPDNDGHNDITNINYHFDAAGYTASVTIFDSRGRRIRKLVANELLGATGSFNWDGVNDKREKAGIGIYIVFIEVFRLDGTVKSFKKTCVLASRL